MKKLITYTTVLLCLAGCNNNQLVKTSSLANDAKPAIPAALLTPANQSWKVSPAEPADKLIKVKFETDGSCIFFYTNKSTEQGAVTQIQGKAVFAVNNYGKNIFTLQPSKGIRFINNKEIPLNINELKEKFSIAYLWEKISFNDMPAEGFLLLVDINEHPAAASIKQGSIDKTWVAKFYSRE